MLNVGKIEEGFVLDHIQAGQSMSIYHHLQLDKLDCPVAIIKNARSEKMGKKDILKVECDVNMMDLDVLAVIDHNITVNIIKNGEIVRKKELILPKEIRNVIQCKNPRCITVAEPQLDAIFAASPPSSRAFPTSLCSPMRRRRSTDVNTAKKNLIKGRSDSENVLQG